MGNPIDLFQGKVLIVVPHMDDEALACGGLIARLPDPSQVHLVYATDGMKSPAPVMPGDAITPDLGETRVQESIAAMQHLGVPAGNLSFLRLPEAELEKCLNPLRAGILGAVQSLLPDLILIPFRFDRHRDHLAVNRIVLEAAHRGDVQAQIYEYFVYYRTRLLPGGDMRAYIHPQHLVAVDIAQVAHRKRQALDCFTSQTTIYYPWQTRPILTGALLDEECAAPEYFLRYDPRFDGAAVLRGPVPWIRIAHRIEPVLQKWKYLAFSRLKRAVQRGN